MIKFVRTAGYSMQPSIKPGAILMVEKLSFWLRKPRIGEIVIFANPHDPREVLCKRIVGFDPGSGEYELRGDNEEDSLDSRKFGKINRSQILGRVIGY